MTSARFLVDGKFRLIISPNGPTANRSRARSAITVAEVYKLSSPHSLAKRIALTICAPPEIGWQICSCGPGTKTSGNGTVTAAGQRAVVLLLHLQRFVAFWERTDFKQYV